MHPLILPPHFYDKDFLSKHKMDERACLFLKDNLAVDTPSRRDFVKCLISTAAAPLINGLCIDPSFAISFEPNTEQESSNSAGTITGSKSTNQTLQEKFWTSPLDLWIYRQKSKINPEINVREVYWENGKLNEEGYIKICQVMGDFHAGKSMYMDIGLLNILKAIQGYYQLWGMHRPLQILSGFRTEATNNALLSEGAAKNSMHLYGKAVDITMPGIPVGQIAWLGTYFKKGGVGFYPKNNFVHLDTGSVRLWTGYHPKKAK